MVKSEVSFHGVCWLVLLLSASTDPVRLRSFRGGNNKRGEQVVADSAVCPSGVSSHFLTGHSAVCWLR